MGETEVTDGGEKSPEVNEIVISGDNDENLPKTEQETEKEHTEGGEKSPEVNGETSEIIGNESDENGEDIIVIPSNSKNENPKTNSNDNWWTTPVKVKNEPEKEEEIKIKP